MMVFGDREMWKFGVFEARKRNSGVAECRYDFAPNALFTPISINYDRPENVKIYFASGILGFNPTYEKRRWKNSKNQQPTTN